MSEIPDLVIPASIGNMGAGFDALSLAVRLYLRVRVRERARHGRGRLEFTFVDRPLEGDNFIERAFRHLAERSGRDFPSLSVEVHSDIPMCAGLGSSAAATVAGFRLYEVIEGRLSAQELLTEACRLEGHPDNTSAAILGGLVGSCALADGSVVALSTPWPESIRLIVLTPDLRLSTAAARRVLPDRIDRADAIFNLQRVALLLQAVQSSRHELLREALRDRWHQPYRQPLVPGLERALALEHPDLLGVCLSGAGPSIVALAEHNISAIEGLMAEAYAALEIPFSIRTLTVHQDSHVDAGAELRRALSTASWSGDL